MFLKELKDTLKQVGSIMTLLVVMPLIYLLDISFYRTTTTFTEYMAGGFALLWLIAIGYLAYNMFRPEEKDNAVEYILSLPINRWKLLIWKTVPRIAVLLVLIGISFGFGFEYIPIGMVAFVVFSQICGFALGIVGRKSWITRLILFVMTICVYFVNSLLAELIWGEIIEASSILPFPTTMLILMGHIGFSQLMYIFIEFGFLALILIPIYRNWDLKPVRGQELSFAKRAIVPLILLACPVVYMLSS